MRVRPALVHVQRHFAGPFANGEMRCRRCGQQLSYGPARDDGEHAERVAVEVRAAEIASGPPIVDHASTPSAADCEVCGRFEIYCVGEPGAPYLAGYLARCIVEHEDDHG